MHLTITREDLDYVGIEKLNLSIKTYNTFRRTGIELVSDVLMIIEAIGAGFPIYFHISTPEIIAEILPKLIEFLHENHSVPSKLIGFDITQLELYNVEREVLNLNEETDEFLRLNGIVAVGDVIDILDTLIYRQRGMTLSPASSRFTDEMINDMMTKTIEYLHDNHRLLA